MNITRIAPSPTGDMHIGTARTAYFNWLAARATRSQSAAFDVAKLDSFDRKYKARKLANG